MEYLFHGRLKGKKKWVCGDLMQMAGKPMIRVDCCDGDRYGDICYYVEPETVGQYIGITDKNGVKVFDGDIIRAIAEGEEDIYTVEWCGDRKYPAFDLKPQIDCDGNGLSYLLWVEAEIEVIGNIHDNPELLGGEA